MYRITNTRTGDTVGIVGKPYYIKISTSGCFTPTTEDNAIGVAVNGTAYNLFGHNEIEDTDTVIVSEINDMDEITNQIWDQMAAAYSEGVQTA